MSVQQENPLTEAEAMDQKVQVTHEEAIRMVTLTAEEKIVEKNLVRRIDLLIMPLVIIVYLLNFIDRNNYAAAKLQGLERDLGLSSVQYQTALSVFYIGYILMQVPSNLLLNYTGRPSLYLGFWVCVWGLVSALTSQVKSFGPLAVCRFILGLSEAPFFAGVLFYLSKWYTKRELAFRMSVFYSGSLLSGAFGSLIAAGILSGLAGKRGLSAWQWLYIIEGSLTCLVGVTIVFILPDFPHTWRMLSTEMQRVANRRLAVDAGEADLDDIGVMSQIKGMKLAFTDRKTYLLALSYFCITGAGGFQNFFPTLTATLKYNHITSLLLVAPPYIFMVFCSLAHNYASDKTGKRFWFFIYPVPISITGFIIFMTTTGFGARYFSFFLMIFVFAQHSVIYGWVASTLPRPPAKRAAAFAFINAIGNSVSIWTPYTYFPSEKPFYRVALSLCTALQLVGGISAFILWRHLKALNKRFATFEDEDATFTGDDLPRFQRLQRTADAEGVDIAVVRRLQAGFRYQL